METTKTERGFGRINFTDRYGIECSLQKSSLATEDCIWLGTDSPRLTVFEDESMGKYIETTLPKNWMVDSRMHLTQDQVRDLLPHLQNFVETGEI